MSSQTTSNRRRRKAPLALESLETRNLLSGGAGNTFAITPGTIDKPGGTNAVTFTIDPAHFTMPRGHMTLGIDVVAAPGTTLKPIVSAVNSVDGRHLHLTHSVYNPKAQRSNASNGALTSAVLVPISMPPNNGNKTVSYTVDITAKDNTSGKFLIGFYLPGDVTGDGVVNQADLQATRAALRTVPGNANYNFEADANRDGRINGADLGILEGNMGVKTTITPIVAANLDPASANAIGNRLTNLKTVHFSGTVTPGATVTYSEINHLAPDVTATADASGNYSLHIPLGLGQNTFKVTTHDAFGQSISGAIAPVTYDPNAPTTVMSVATNPTSGTGTKSKT